MIIKRKYECLGILCENDKLSKEAIDNAFALSGVSNERKEELLSYNYANISAFLNTGCLIPGECYAQFMSDFDRLDLTDPYDNGLTFKDVGRIDFETSRKGTAIQMRFISEKGEKPYRIVGFATIQNKNGAITMDEGWQMGNPFVIG